MTRYEILYLNIERYIAIMSNLGEIISNSESFKINIDNRQGLCYGLVSMWGSMYLRGDHQLFADYINKLTAEKINQVEFEKLLNSKPEKTDSLTLSEFIKNLLINQFHNDIVNLIILC